MERVELEKTAYEFAKKYDKYSHMTKDGRLYGIDIFLKEEMDVNELELIVCKLCFLNLRNAFKITFKPMKGFVMVPKYDVLSALELFENFFRANPVSETEIAKDIHFVLFPYG